MSDIYKEGELEKKGGGIRQVWQSRYFRLHTDGRLTYAKSASVTPLGSLHVANMRSITAGTGKKECEFTIDYGTGKVYCFRGDNVPERADWVDAIEHVRESAAAQANAPAPSAAPANHELLDELADLPEGTYAVVTPDANIVGSVDSYGNLTWINPDDNNNGGGGGGGGGEDVGGGEDGGGVAGEDGGAVGDGGAESESAPTDLTGSLDDLVTAFEQSGSAGARLSLAAAIVDAAAQVRVVQPATLAFLEAYVAAEGSSGGAGAGAADVLIASFLHTAYTTVASLPVADRQWIQTTVSYIKCSGMVSCDSNGLSDPFLVIKAGDTEIETKVIYKTLDPEWKEIFVLPPVPNITIHCWDKDRLSSDDYMGSVNVTVGRDLDKPVTQTLSWTNDAAHPNDPVSGTITLTVCKVGAQRAE